MVDRVGNVSPLHAPTGAPHDDTTDTPVTPAGSIGLGPGTTVPTTTSLHLTPPAIGEIRPLRDAELRTDRDPALQSMLGGLVAELGVSDMARDKRLALAVVDLTDPSTPRFAGLNENTELYAASLPKIGVLVGTLSLVASGELDLDGTLGEQFSAAEREQFAAQVVGSASEQRRFATRVVGRVDPESLDRLTVRELLAVMMQQSSNAAPALLHRHVGKSRLQQILRETGLFDSHTDSGLWLGKYYGPDPKSERRYHRGGSQNATALQVARFYTLVATGKLFSPELSAAATEAMSALAPDGSAILGHKFMHALPDASPAPVRVLRKSGTTAYNQTHADSVLVETAERRYVLVMLARGAGASGLAERLIGPVHRQMTTR